MEIVYNPDEVLEYMQAAVKISKNHPILVDKYITGKELEVDGICDGYDVVIPGIMEHIERAGIHSGDSFAIYPSQTLSDTVKKKLVDYSIRIARALNIKGLFNIQFVLDHRDEIYVLEVNPRASRTVPILSKITGTPMVSLATKIMLGKTLKEMGYSTGLIPESPLVTVKAPVFSFSKLNTVDIFLGPEMKSTGEVMGTDTSYIKALSKAILASGMNIPFGGNVLFSVSNRDKDEAAEIAKELLEMGFKLYATNDTYQHFITKGIKTELVRKDEIIQFLKDDCIHLIINTPTRGKLPSRLGFVLRRTSMEFNIPCITSLDTAKAAIQVLKAQGEELNVIPLHEYCNKNGKVIIRG